MDDDHEEHLTHVKGYFNFDNNTTVAFALKQSHAGLMRQGNVLWYLILGRKWIQRVTDIVKRVNDTWDGRRPGYKIESVSKKTLKDKSFFSNTVAVKRRR